MTLYRNGDSDEHKRHVGLYLHLESANRKDFLAKWSFTLRNENGLEVKRLSSEYKGEDFGGKGYGFPKFISHRELSKHVKQCSKVTIICEVKILAQTMAP